MSKVWKAFVLEVLILGAGCGPRVEPLRIAAASDLQGALPGVARAFTGRTGIETSLTFGASGQLAEQIKAGAPFDVFLSANRAFVDDLARGRFVREDSVAPYAVGALVLVVGDSDSSRIVLSLADLARPEVTRIALANPATAPYGAAGKQALERSGLWAAVASKVAQAETVRQALQFVESGNAEAGLVSRANARASSARFMEIDPALYDPIRQTLGVVAATRHADAAGAFRPFLRGDEGQALLVQSGFSRVEP